jgi:NTE family protein
LKITSLILFIIISSSTFSQKVGLVLSGGGASGFAHIGVLKALEEKGIPIDYITGTSAGALIGAMYASGYSPTEIENYVLGKKFQNMTQGRLMKNQSFYFLTPDDDGSVIDIPFAKDSILLKSLPTNFISSVLLDYEMMKNLGTTSASYHDNFDSLFVPFRCVASDISNKQSVIFKDGKLNLAVRASTTYPFFISPIQIDGKLLFDGGLYNNFPIDVMYQEFNADYIIGSNVSSNATKPTEDDLLSQITNMLVAHTNFSLPCENGLIIQPKTNLSTFEFENVKDAIESGYSATIKIMDSIYMSVSRRLDIEKLSAERAAFRKKIKPLNISQVSAYSNNSKDLKFVRNSILKVNKSKLLSVEKLEKRYFRTSNFEQVENLYPFLDLLDSTYALNINVKKTKEFKLHAGGHFSSRPINTGYLGLSYLYIKKYAVKAKAESYFGRFYGSVKTTIDFTIPNYYPITFSPYFVMNRWDYFRSSATFFEDVKPSFLVQNEIYSGFKIKVPVGNKGKSIIDGRLFELDDNYYQSKNFTSKDTADITRFKGSQLSWALEFNSLNKKQFANGGFLFMLKFRFVNGKERSISGSTSPEKYDITKYHQWIQLNSELQSFFIDEKRVHVGIHFKTIVNSQSLFKNYTATLLNTTEFAPIPDISSFFLSEYRAPQHAGVGLNLIYTPLKNIDFRADIYYYQPFKQLVILDNGGFQYSKPFKGEAFLHSFSAIYHSPIGPLRATLNYLPKQAQVLNFQVSYGYLLFNERAIR